MPISKDSLYGWGVCQIPMPRASCDVYDDRRIHGVAHDGPERRQEIILQPFSAVCLSIMRRDFPAGITLLVAIFALMSIVFLSLVSLLIPQVMEEVVPEPVEIVARILEEPLPPPPVKMSVLTPPVATPEKPSPVPKAIPPVPIEKPKVLRPLKEKVVIVKPEESKPELKLRKPMIARQEKQVEKSLPMPKKTVALNAVKKNVDLEPLTSAKEKTYDLLQEKNVPLSDNSSRFTDRKVETRIALNSPSKDYKPSEQGQQGKQGRLPPGKTTVSAAVGTTIDVPSPASLKKTFALPRSQGDGSAPVSGKSFSPLSDKGEVSLGRVEAVGGSYRGVTRVSGGTIPIGRQGALKISKTVGVNLPDPGTKVDRSVAAGEETAIDLQAGPVSFASDPGAEVDPALFVSVNQLGACICQSEDDRLSTELAVALETNTQCRAGGMIFHILNPVDRYNVQVSVYNPIKFADKCAALSAAIECINLKQ